MTNFPETFPLIIIDETNSTNHYLDQLCRNESARPAEYTTVIAQFQTAGKGQRGNSWESEDGKNLLFSYVLYPTFVEARHQFVLSQIASLAVKEELDQWTDGVSIKWPNDVYRDDRKICGMLLENDLCGAYIGRHISGIGVNINQETFRDASTTVPPYWKASCNGCATSTNNFASMPTAVSRPLLPNDMPPPCTAAKVSIPIAMPTAISVPDWWVWNPTAVSYWKTSPDVCASICSKRCNTYYKSTPTVP